LAWSAPGDLLWVGKTPLGRKWQPNSRVLANKESDTTEHMHGLTVAAPVGARNTSTHYRILTSRDDEAPRSYNPDRPPPEIISDIPIAASPTSCDNPQPLHQHKLFFDFTKVL